MQCVFCFFLSLDAELKCDVDSGENRKQYEHVRQLLFRRGSEKQQEKWGYAQFMCFNNDP